MELQGPKKWFAAKEGPRQEQAIFSGSVNLNRLRRMFFKPIHFYIFIKIWLFKCEDATP